jgi:excisionase family DNA binding protein
MSAPESKIATGQDMRLVVAVGEAANMLGISERHLQTLSTKGNLPRVQIGARVCYRVETLRAWVAAHETAGEAKQIYP